MEYKVKKRWRVYFMRKNRVGVGLLDAVVAFSTFRNGAFKTFEEAEKAIQHNLPDELQSAEVTILPVYEVEK